MTTNQLQHNTDEIIKRKEIILQIHPGGTASAAQVVSDNKGYFAPFVQLLLLEARLIMIQTPESSVHHQENRCENGNMLLMMMLMKVWLPWKDFEHATCCTQIGFIRFLLLKLFIKGTSKSYYKTR